MGLSRSVSRVPGAAPRTSTPATAPSSVRITVQPVGLRESVKCPTLIPATSVIDLLSSKVSRAFAASPSPKMLTPAAAIAPPSSSRRVGFDFNSSSVRSQSRRDAGLEPRVSPRTRGSCEQVPRTLEEGGGLLVSRQFHDDQRVKPVHHPLRWFAPIAGGHPFRVGSLALWRYVNL